jgi:prepilin-type N-terminal cleavage/methylation domain-containing protein
LRAAFTLIELLVVIAIIGILAAMTGPIINNFKPNYIAAASSQLLNDVKRARQLAISQRTTVYMVFVPIAGSWTTLPGAASLYEKQLIGYNFAVLRSVGDQPGVQTPRYLSQWRTLPDGAFIYLGKFVSGSSLQIAGYTVNAFNSTVLVPFPTSYTPAGYASLSYIAFDSTGRLVSSANEEVIPLTKGSVSFARDPVTKAALPAAPTFTESPPGNTTNGYNLICIDPVTGYAHIERPKIQ